MGRGRVADRRLEARLFGRIILLAALDGERSGFFQALFNTYAAVFPRVLAFAAKDPQDGSGWHNIIIAPLASARKPLLVNREPDLAATLARRVDARAASGCPPLPDEYAPVDRYIMSAW